LKGHQLGRTAGFNFLWAVASFLVQKSPPLNEL
jgi:hypothetical protein